MQQINNINVDGTDELFCFIWGGYPYKPSEKKYDRIFDKCNEITVIQFCNKYKQINAD